MAVQRWFQTELGLNPPGTSSLYRVVVTAKTRVQDARLFQGMFSNVWNESDHHTDMSRITNGAHIEIR